MREQDIEKIVRVYSAQETIKGYSRFVPYTEILEENGGSLNVPLYIHKIDKSLPHSLAAHIYGGIPKHDIDSLARLWEVSPELKNTVFDCTDPTHDIWQLALPSDEIEDVFEKDIKLQDVKHKEGTDIFDTWKNEVRDVLLGITDETDPKAFIRGLGSMVLDAYDDSHFLDNYDVYDCLMNYWNEKLQDDVYAIKVYGYDAAREIEYTYAQKKVKDESGETIMVDDKSKVKSFDGALIPRSVIETEFFGDKQKEITVLTEKREQLASEMEEVREEESGEDGLLKEVLSDSGDLPKANLTKRIKELDARKTSPEMMALETLMDSFGTSDTAELENVAKATPAIEKYGIRNKNGTLAKAKLKAALKAATDEATMPEIYQDEYEVLMAYQAKLNEYDSLGKDIKKAQKELDDLVLEKYGALTEEEIKRLLFDGKWMPRLHNDINSEIERILNEYAASVIMIAKRYEYTLKELEEKTAEANGEVHKALERMGYK